MTPTLKRVAAAAALGLLLIVGLVTWYLSRDAAPEVTLDAAAEAAADRTPAADAGGDGAGTVDAPTEAVGSVPADLTGTWAIAGGDADDVDAGTFVGYRVEEELRGIGATTATGRTPLVSGGAVVDGGTLVSAEVLADVTGLRSDEGFRDQALRTRGLETATFPQASFVLTQPVALPAGAGDGSAFAFTAVGDLTLHGVTRTVSWDLEGTVVGDTLVLVGTLPVVMSDHGITPPTAQRVLSIADDGLAEVQLLLTLT